MTQQNSSGRFVAASLKRLLMTLLLHSCLLWLRFHQISALAAELHIHNVMVILHIISRVQYMIFFRVYVRDLGDISRRLGCLVYLCFFA